MKLDKFHVRDLHACAPRHRHAVSRRDVWIRRVQIDFAATASRQHDAIGPDRFHFSGVFIQDIDTEATVFCGKTEFRCGEQVHRHVIFHQVDV